MAKEKQLVTTTADGKKYFVGDEVTPTAAILEKFRRVSSLMETMSVVKPELAKISCSLFKQGSADPALFAKYSSAKDEHGFLIREIARELLVQIGAVVPVNFYPRDNKIIVRPWREGESQATVAELIKGSVDYTNSLQFADFASRRLSEKGVTEMSCKNDIVMFSLDTSDAIAYRWKEATDENLFMQIPLVADLIMIFEEYIKDDNVAPPSLIGVFKKSEVHLTQVPQQMSETQLTEVIETLVGSEDVEFKFVLNFTFIPAEDKEKPHRPGVIISLGDMVSGGVLIMSLDEESRTLAPYKFIPLSTPTTV